MLLWDAIIYEHVELEKPSTYSTNTREKYEDFAEEKTPVNWEINQPAPWQRKKAKSDPSPILIS